MGAWVLLEQTSKSRRRVHSKKAGRQQSSQSGGSAEEVEGESSGSTPGFFFCVLVDYLSLKNL